MTDLDLGREIGIMKMFSHPHIVRLHEVIDDPKDEKLHLIMDYCPNGQIMTFNEENFTFNPPDSLIEQATYFNYC